MRHGSLESGQGGFDLAAEMVGWDNVFHCEINPFCRTILKYYWPKAKSYADVFEFDGTEWRGKVDIITGGFPCQPFSNAGKRKGSSDDRHIWPENMRIVGEAQPPFCVFENVPGLLTIEDGMVFEQVCLDLENEGYEVTPLIIPACATDKDHRRDRVWIVAYSHSNGQRRRGLGEHSETQAKSESQRDKRERLWSELGREDTDVTNQCKYGFDTCAFIGQSEMCSICEDGDNYEPDESADWCTDTITGYQGLQGHKQCGAFEQGTRTPRPIAKPLKNEHWLEAATRLCSVDDGLSGGLDALTISKGKWRTESLKAHGNAIVPDIAIELFKAIQSSLQL